MLNGASCEGGHVDVEEEAERDDGEMQQMVSSLANLGEQVVVLDDDPGAGAVLLTDQGVAGQQIEKDVVMPAWDVDMGAPQCPLSGFLPGSWHRLRSPFWARRPRR